MANIVTDARVALQGLMASSWSDCSVLFNVEEAERMNWRYMVDRFEHALSNGLQPPWGVLQLGVAQQADFGITNDAYELDAHCWYITSLRDPSDGSAKTPAVYLAEVEQATRDLMRSVRAYTGAAFSAGDMSYDASDGNPANKYFSGVNAPFFAALASVRLLIGDQG